MILITHDMGVIAEMSERVVVLYAGRVCEIADKRELFRNPLHPYTKGLLVAVPRLDKRRGDLAVIPGSIPNLIDPPLGCRFHPRCECIKPICRKQIPELSEIRPGHYVACLNVK